MWFIPITTIIVYIGIELTTQKKQLVCNNSFTCYINNPQKKKLILYFIKLKFKIIKNVKVFITLYFKRKNMVAVENYIFIIGK
ncbi:LOW QUALITY PROTEIN: hypothetical protein PFMC_02254 [Plasmodium falciparum CAMP/Malaysia]|nr:LOW QUALITY PROTEIN: hypothetical protein PFMC_02254 [Plasmodium falciparum CAMP/Malaysia]